MHGDCNHRDMVLSDEYIRTFFLLLPTSLSLLGTIVSLYEHMFIREVYFCTMFRFRDSRSAFHLEGSFLQPQRLYIFRAQIPLTA